MVRDILRSTLRGSVHALADVAIMLQCTLGNYRWSQLLHIFNCCKTSSFHCTLILEKCQHHAVRSWKKRADDPEVICLFIYTHISVSSKQSEERARALSLPSIDLGASRGPTFCSHIFPNVSKLINKIPGSLFV